MDSMLDILLNHGSLGVFAAFLIWLYTNMQQRMDELVNKFQAQIDEMRKDQKTEQELLRVRYDDVIGKYDSERKQMRLQIKEKIEKVGNISQKIDQRTSNILVRQESNNDDLGSLDKKIAIMADHIKIMSDLLKQMEQEQRVRNLVKMAHGENTIPPK
jgi:methyl-accepting chemotaxis protein